MTVTDTTATPEAGNTGPDGFDQHREENPRIEQALVELLDEARAAGVERIGVDVLWGRLRWEYHIAAKGEDWALNNNWRSYWARLLMIEYPRFDGMFVLRRADDADQWQADYIARKHAAEFDLPYEGLFAIDLPQQRRGGQR